MFLVIYYLLIISAVEIEELLKCGLGAPSVPVKPMDFLKS